MNLWQAVRASAGAWWLTVWLCWGVGLACAQVDSVEQPAGEAFRLGLLLDYTGPLGVHGLPTEAGVRLALEHVNTAGGVLGQPVTLWVADGETDPLVAVEQARRLAAEGVHAILGPSGSAAALAVAREISGPMKLPTVSPSATSPELTNLADDDFFFRTTLSDSAQGAVLASIATRNGFSKLVVVFQPDTYGKGLLQTFDDAYDGDLIAIEARDTRPYLEDLRSAIGDGAEALVVFTYIGVAEKVLAESTSHGLFDSYLLADAITTADLAHALGPEALTGMMGTGPGGSGAEHQGSLVVAGEMRDRFGHAPKSASLAAYDAAICLCLAAERAASFDGAAVRKALRRVCGGSGGRSFGAGSAGVRDALSAIRSGEAIDFDGSSSDIDLDAAGDATDGFVGVYRFSDGLPILVERIRFSP